MTLELGMKVLHPSYPHWGEGTVIDLEYPTIQFDEPEGGRRRIAKENLTDLLGRTLADEMSRPKTKGQLRQEAKDRAAAVRIEKEEKEKAIHEESLRRTVEYLLTFIDDVELCTPLAKTENEAEDLQTFYKAHTHEELEAVNVDSRIWGLSWCITFPIVVDAPFEIVAHKSSGFRGPHNKRDPLASLMRGGDRCIMCCTEVTKRLIESGRLKVRKLQTI